MEAKRWAKCEQVSYFDSMVPKVSLVESTDDDLPEPVQLPDDEGIGLLSQTHASLRICVDWQRDVFVLVNPFVAHLAHKDVRIRLEVETYQKLVPGSEPLKEAASRPDWRPESRNVMMATPRKASVLSKEDMESQGVPQVNPDAESIDIGRGNMEPTIDAWPTGFTVFTTQDAADQHFIDASGKGPFYVRREAIQDNENRFGDRKRKRSPRGQARWNADLGGDGGAGFIHRVNRQCRRVVKRQWRGIKRRAYDTWITAARPVIDTVHYLRSASWPEIVFKETGDLLDSLRIPQNLGKWSSARRAYGLRVFVCCLSRMAGRSSIDINQTAETGRISRQRYYLS